MIDAPKRWQHAILAIAAACPMACVTEPPATIESFQTDRAEYVLAANPVLPVPMRVTFTNGRSAPVYFHLSCGSGPTLSRSFVRVAGGTTPVALGSSVCLSMPLLPPVRVESGATVVDTLPLQVGRWVQGEWAAKLAMDTGTFRLRYDVQTTARTSGGWDPVDLLPVEERQSNVFRVRLPNQRLTVAARAPAR